MGQNQNIPRRLTGKILVEMKCSSGPSSKVETYYVVASSHEAAFNLFKRKFSNYHVLNTSLVACERIGMGGSAPIWLIVEEN